VEEAQGLLKLCDQFKVERDDLKTQIGLKPPSMGADGKFTCRDRIQCCVSASVSDPEWIQIQSSQWIRIRIQEGKNDPQK
jgi:hypothetical protein